MLKNYNYKRPTIALCFPELYRGTVSPAELVYSSVLDCNSNRARTISRPKPQREQDASFQDAAPTCINKKLLSKSPFISLVNEVEFKRRGIGGVCSGCTGVQESSVRACLCYLYLQSCVPLFPEEQGAALTSCCASQGSTPPAPSILLSCFIFFNALLTN